MKKKLYKLYEKIATNNRYELMNNGYERGECDYVEIWYDSKNKYFIEVGFNRSEEVVYIYINE